MGGLLKIAATACVFYICTSAKVGAELVCPCDQEQIHKYRHPQNKFCDADYALSFRVHSRESTTRNWNNMAENVVLYRVKVQMVFKGDEIIKKIEDASSIINMIVPDSNDCGFNMDLNTLIYVIAKETTSENPNELWLTKCDYIQSTKDITPNEQLSLRMNLVSYWNWGCARCKINECQDETLGNYFCGGPSFGDCMLRALNSYVPYFVSACRQQKHIKCGWTVRI